MTLTPREAASERALEELELEGAVPTTRQDFLLGAVAYLTRLLVLAKGLDPDELDKIVGSGGANLVRFGRETPFKRRVGDAETTRRFFDILDDLAKG